MRWSSPRGHAHAMVLIARHTSDSPRQHDNTSDSPRQHGHASMVLHRTNGNASEGSSHRMGAHVIVLIARQHAMRRSASHAPDGQPLGDWWRRPTTRRIRVPARSDVAKFPQIEVRKDARGFGPLTRDQRPCRIVPLRMLGNSDTNNMPNSPPISNTLNARGFGNTSRPQLAVQRARSARLYPAEIKEHERQRRPERSYLHNPDRKRCRMTRTSRQAPRSHSMTGAAWRFHSSPGADSAEAKFDDHHRDSGGRWSLPGSDTLCR